MYVREMGVDVVRACKCGDGAPARAHTDTTSLRRLNRCRLGLRGRLTAGWGWRWRPAREDSLSRSPERAWHLPLHGLFLVLDHLVEEGLILFQIVLLLKVALLRFATFQLKIGQRRLRRGRRLAEGARRVSVRT